ncbi:hypothetical protein FDECE_821 [Fusarium decemcellulare]|nr:hypothetical protein FDECE_821 [Fusarium decemcellulare]
MAEPIDLAISSSLFAYRTGRNDRQQRLVIRPRLRLGDLSANQDPSVRAIIDRNHGTSAVPSWTDEELDISTASADTLFVVVGELLPNNHLFELSYRIVLGSATFDPSIHTTVGPTEGTFIVVRPIRGERSVMYLLYDRSDGVSSVALLPECYERFIVYYDEWVTGFAHTIKERRRDGYRSNLSAFCREFMAQRFPGPVQRRPASTIQAEDQETGTQVDDSMDTQEDPGAETGEAQINTSELLFPDIQDLFTKFDASGDKAWLFLAIKRLDAMCDNEFFNDLSVKGQLRMKIEWNEPGPASTNVTAPIILKMVEGLRHGALRGVYIHHDLRRLLITQFCDDWVRSPCEDGLSLKNKIETIYTCYKSLMQTGKLVVE